MKKLVPIFALALCILLPLAASAQTLEELLQKNGAARGGIDKLKAIQTMHQSVNLSTQGMDIPLLIVVKAPNKVRTEADAAGMKFITAFDGTKGWSINPMASGSPELLPESQYANLSRQANPVGVLLAAKEVGLEAKLVGEVTSPEGRKEHRIDLTSPEGEVITVYLDAETMLESRVETDVDNPQMGKMRVESLMSDYRDVNGIKTPFRVIQRTGGQVLTDMTVTSVKINEPVDDSIFVMPGN